MTRVCGSGRAEEWVQQSAARPAATIVVQTATLQATNRRRFPPLFSGSAVGIYGDRGDEVLDETSAEGSGVLADLCRSWEAATRPAAERASGWSRSGPASFSGAPGAPGAGYFAPRCPSSSSGSGPASATAASGQAGSPSTTRSPSCSRDRRRQPSRAGERDLAQPGPNAELTAVLAQALGRRSRLVVPAPVLRLALGRGAADELLLASQKVMPRKLTEAGYTHSLPRVVRRPCGCAVASGRQLRGRQSRFAPCDGRSR